ncbi:MAG: hypothetical protein CVV03_11720 [Firmicutes bacterium HGW-Firmicutes-8]|nr:MAG: hypothetical protein CVV03_11720 [Firmicutes bacterium HGW-Firmicutes-8]
MGILTGFPLAAWQSKLPPAGRKAMFQNLMAQIAFLIRWPPPVSKSKNLPAAFDIFKHAGTPCLAACMWQQDCQRRQRKGNPYKIPNPSS